MSFFCQHTWEREGRGGRREGGEGKRRGGEGKRRGGEEEERREGGLRGRSMVTPMVFCPPATPGPCVSHSWWSTCRLGY